MYAIEKWNICSNDCGCDYGVWCMVHIIAMKYPTIFVQSIYLRNGSYHTNDDIANIEDKNFQFLELIVSLLTLKC